MKDNELWLQFFTQLININEPKEHRTRYAFEIIADQADIMLEMYQLRYKTEDNK